MALGARKGQVLLLMLREATALVSAGTVLGFLGAFALAKILSRLTSIFVDALGWDGRSALACRCATATGGAGVACVLRASA